MPASIGFPLPGRAARASRRACAVSRARPRNWCLSAKREPPRNTSARVPARARKAQGAGAVLSGLASLLTAAFARWGLAARGNGPWASLAGKDSGANTAHTAPVTRRRERAHAFVAIGALAAPAPVGGQCARTFPGQFGGCMGSDGLQAPARLSAPSPPPSHRLIAGCRRARGRLLVRSGRVALSVPHAENPAERSTGFVCSLKAGGRRRGRVLSWWRTGSAG